MELGEIKYINCEDIIILVLGQLTTFWYSAAVALSPPELTNITYFCRRKPIVRSSAFPFHWDFPWQKMQLCVHEAPCLPRQVKISLMSCQHGLLSFKLSIKLICFYQWQYILIYISEILFFSWTTSTNDFNIIIMISSLWWHFDIERFSFNQSILFCLLLRLVIGEIVVRCEQCCSSGKTDTESLWYRRQAENIKGADIKGY